MTQKYLTQWEKNVVSQTGEDGVIEHIVNAIGEGGKAAVEFGAADGKWLSNTWNLENSRGWRRWLFDSDASAPGIVRAQLTVENINEEFDKAGVPNVIDVLSVDVDGNDLWLWHALKRRARLTVIEYNVNVMPPQAVAIQYNPNHQWDHTSYFGATLSALDIVGRSKGLRLVHTTTNNAFFLSKREAELVGMPEILPEWTAQVMHPPDRSPRLWIVIEK